MKTISMASRSGPRSGKGTYIPDLGDIVFVDFDPSIGTEMAKARPDLVLTPRSYNGIVGRCFTCPITSRGRGYPYEVALPAGLKTHGFVMADQGRPVAWRERGASFVEAAPQDIIDDVKAKIQAFLQIA